MSVEPELPWRDYTRSSVPRGFSHAIGRDAVEASLRAAGARIGSLSFGPLHTEAGANWSMVFDVYWIGDGDSRVFGHAPGSDAARLLMRWHAVPAALRASLATEISHRWLHEACNWAAAAPDRGNVWRATDHRWMLVREDGALLLREN